MISAAKQNALKERMQKLQIREADLTETFIRGGGKGGQKINKTASCVQLLHQPSGIEIRCQRSRSQAGNRYLARRELCDRLEEKIRGAKSARRQRIEKIRRQKRKRSRRAKEKMLQNKHHRARAKTLRKPVNPDRD